MASYVPLGLACGVLGAKCGIDPARSLVLSLTTFTGGGQYWRHAADLRFS